ncbi:enoyl-CoA hydratase-related protein [Sphingomonas psychrolutea]|uniref:Enoyl-CoA hydratase n=1 Tax=Sphingomonas psychrolutea TaxID=1259676 RepID=A0ABQ1G397_9SPHN|nr:enoyl-CoA hydratase-related protein [Sphingomonas psychrolutea]GGA36643.1 enoyl-CoA hydratase [Sphingomonas psychrolutea]
MSNPDDAKAVLAEVADGIMTITLNRPDRGNAWNGPMAWEYFALLEQAARASDVRAIIVTGAGKAFCVGGDGEKLAVMAETGDTKPAAAQPYWFPLSIGKPIIAAINGACFGIGLQQALVSDIRFASEDAKFSTAYARRGLVAEMGMSWLLPRLVGTGHAMDLLISARLVRAAEAERMGLINRVVAAGDLLAEARAYAKQLVDHCAPRSMRAIKEQCFRDLTNSFFDGFARSETLLNEAFGHADFKEGMRSWQEGRAPAFPALPDELALLDLKA